MVDARHEWRGAGIVGLIPTELQTSLQFVLFLLVYFRALRMTSKPVFRVTMFKLPSEEDRKQLLEEYKNMNATAVKVRDFEKF